MSLSRSGNTTFDNAVVSAESTLQGVTGLSTSTQAQETAAAIVFYRAVVASGVTNSIDVGPFIHALKNLGSTP